MCQFHLFYSKKKKEKVKKIKGRNCTAHKLKYTSLQYYIKRKKKLDK